MTRPRTVAPISAIRNAADEAVRAGSLRSVAAAIGLSPTGLRNFLDGRSPYSPTIRKLNAWYVDYELNRRSFSTDTARAGMALLLEAVPEAQQEKAVALLLECLRSIHRECQAKAPAWLEKLRGQG